MKQANKDIKNSDPNTCPYCKGEHITVEATDQDDDVHWDKIFCWDCKVDWLEIYKYSHRESLHPTIIKQPTLSLAVLRGK